MFFDSKPPPPFFDPVLHSPARLRIMALLTRLPVESQESFRSLAQALDLTDGNLGAHLQTLAKAGVGIGIDKGIVANKPLTRVSATPRGRANLERYRAQLRMICDI